MCGGFTIKKTPENEKHARLLLEFIRANPDKDVFDLMDVYKKNNKPMIATTEGRGLPPGATSDTPSQVIVVPREEYVEPVESSETEKEKETN